MGLDVSFSIVVGFKVLYKIQKTQKTQYNPDTGTPYSVSVDVLICDHEPSGLDSFYVDGEYPEEEHTEIWGLTFSNTPSHRHRNTDDELIIKIDLPLLSEMVDSMSKKYPNEEISAFCVPYFSY